MTIPKISLHKSNIEQQHRPILDPPPADWILRATLVDYARRVPELELGMIEGSRARLGTALRNGAIDIAIVTGETQLPHTKSMSLWSERLLAVVSDGHRLAANEIVHWTDLKGEALLLSQRDPGHEIHDMVVARLASPVDGQKWCDMI